MFLSVSSTSSPYGGLPFLVLRVLSKFIASNVTTLSSDLFGLF